MNFYDGQLNKFIFLVSAKGLSDAVQIVSDFSNMYWNIQSIIPIKVGPLGALVIADDDEAIPEKERKRVIDDKPYYKVSARLDYIDFDGKEKTIDSDCIVNAADVGEAKIRANRFYRRHWKDSLEGPDNVGNKIIIRKAAPYSVSQIVPFEYSMLYYKKSEDQVTL